MNNHYVICFGFVAIDVVLLNTMEVLKPAVGGTSANVCLALNHLGVPASIAAVVGTDKRGLFLLSEFERRKISVPWIEQRPNYSTPFCIELLDSNQDGYRSHGFRAVNFHSQLRSTRFVSPSLETLKEISESMSSPSIVYSNKQFDGLVSLIDKFNPRFVYEPDCIDDQNIHIQLVERANIFKFNHAQFMGFAVDAVDLARGAVIETFGAEGARFRAAPTAAWRRITVSGGPKIVDATGAGDWFTASLIRDMVEFDQPAHEYLVTSESVETASKIARISCCYPGAMGVEKDAAWRSKLEELSVCWDQSNSDLSIEQRVEQALDAPCSES